MFIKWLDNKKNSNSKILFKCDICGEDFIKINKNYLKILKNKDYDKDHCTKCWRKKLNNRPEYLETMSTSIKKMYKDNPNILYKKRKSMLGKNKGIKNGMKKQENREKVSNTRKKMFKDNPELKKELSYKTREAWKNGKFKGVSTGRCKWYEYIDNKGNRYKVQGTWELKFIIWLNENNYDYICHRKRIPYILNNEEHSYYPDFFIKQWNSYVDVKAECWYKKEKFDAIRKSNPDLKLKILFKEDLLKLGVNI